MTGISFDIESNFKLYVNEAIEQFQIAMINDEQKNYKFSSIFAGITIELGFALIVKEGMHENIYDKNKRTIKFKEIKKKFERNLEGYVKKILKGYAYIEQEPSNINLIKNIEIKSEILEIEILAVINLRNDLVHNKGEFYDTQIGYCIFNSLLFLNILLPEKYKFDNILNKEIIGTYLKNCTDEEMLIKVSSAFEIFQKDDCQHYISTIEDVIYDCAECGHHSMINIGGKDNLVRPGYLCLLCVNHGYLKDCTLCGTWIPYGKEIEWNKEYLAYICEDCNDEFTDKLGS